MKFTVSNKGFGDCIKKMQPVLHATKEKKEVIESLIRLSVVKSQKIAAGNVGIALGCDGKKQFLSVFLIEGLQMEEEQKDIYISGKKLYDIFNILANGSETLVDIEVETSCLIKKGTSCIQVPLGEECKFFKAGDGWIAKTKVSTNELKEVLFKGGRFYSPNTEGLTSSVSIYFNIKQKNLQVCSTDLYRMGSYEIKTEYEFNLSKKNEEMSTSTNKNAEEEIICQIDGEELRFLAKFLEGENTEILIYEKYIYFKSNNDIAMYILKELDKQLSMRTVLSEIKNLKEECKISLNPKHLLDALDIFDVSNQEAEPYVHILKDNNALNITTKGRTSKTLIPANIEGDFKPKLILHSKMIKSILVNYNKNESITIYIGNKGQILFKENDNSQNFNVATRIEE